MNVRQVKRSHALHTARSYLRQRERDCIALGARAEVPPVPCLARMRARGPLRVRACARVRSGAWRVRVRVCALRVCVRAGVRALVRSCVCSCVCVHGRACVRARVACVTPSRQVPNAPRFSQICKLRRVKIRVTFAKSPIKSGIP